VADLLAGLFAVA